MTGMFSAHHITDILVRTTHLLYAFFTRDIQHSPSVDIRAVIIFALVLVISLSWHSHERCQLQQQRAFADAWIPTDKDQSPGNHAAAEDTRNLFADLARKR